MRRHLATLAASVAMTLVAGTAWAFWSADSAPGGNGAAAATSVNQGATPSGSVSGQSVTVSWAATTLSSGQPVTGYLIKRFDSVTLVQQTINGACAGVVTGTSCVEANVPVGSWRYSVTPVIGANWQGAESVRSSPVLVVAVDITAPTNSLSVSSVTGGAFLSGTTVYYRGAAVGSFRVTNAVSDAGSGPASSTTGAFSGTSTGWTHTPSTVSTPAGGPYVSNLFSWGAATSSGPQVTVTGRDVANNAAPTTLTFTNDSTAPTASVSYADGPAASPSIAVTFSASDGGAGLDTRQLQRASATLTGSSCGTFSSFTNVGPAQPTSPYTDTNVGGGNCYRYQYVVTDRVGNQQIATNANVAKVDYAGSVNGTAGLLSHWRLGEASASVTSSDSFNGTNGTLLTARSGEIGATWVNPSGNSNMVIGTQNRAYRNASGFSIMYTTATPPAADYSVEADLHYRGAFAANAAGVIGRFNTANTSFYMARWENDNTWNIVKWQNGAPTWLSSTAAQTPLVVGETYRVRLEISGTSTTTLKLHVNGVQRLSVNDSSSPFTAAGKAGLMAGETGDPAQIDTTGIQFENFQAYPSTYPRAADSKGSNTGDYKNGVTLGASGALAGDTNTAAVFDGLNDYVQMTGTAGFPVGAAVRSTELWLKTSSSARQVLFRYGTGANTQEYGLWLDSGGSSMTAWGFGGGNDKVFTLASAVNNGAWHQVVLTYNGTSLTLYVDGVARPTQAATRNTAMDAYGFGIGAVIRPNDGNSGGFFNGSIDEVSFYTSALTAQQVADHYALGTAVVDTTGPTGGSVDATGLVGTGSRYAPSTTLSLALAKGTDPSGVAATGAELRRSTATLNGGAGTCGTFGSSTLVATDPTSPAADTVADQACYRYEYVVADTLGNVTTYTSPSIKVDRTAPTAPTLAFSAFTNTWWPGSGSTVYYRSSATPGSFTATASATDSASGIASYSFPGLGTNWTSTPGALGVNTYSWSGAPAAPGTKNVTATNNAALVSANAPFTLTDDTTAPAAGTVTYADTTQTSTSVSVTFTTGTDGGSGVGTRLLQRASAPLTGATCGTYGAFATVSGGTDPTSPFTDTVTTGSCHKYQYVVSDNVGNAHTATSANVVKVPAACGDQLLANGGFENGAVTAPWTTSPASGVVINNGTVAARTGTWKAMLGGQGTDTTETLSQDVTIPAGCTVTLSYWLRVTTAETSHPWDFFRVQVIDGATTTTLDTLDDSDLGGSYVQHTVDLSAYAGKTVTLRFLSDEDGSVQTSFWLDDVSLDTAVASYFDTVQATAGLLSHYRLGEATTSADSMTGTAGATLQSRNGETGATWTKHGASSGDAVLTSAGRVRKSGATLGALYYTSAVPASADYTVEADIHFAGTEVTNDIAGVVGRVNTGSSNYYVARYEQANHSWNLHKVVGGTWSFLGSSPQTPAGGSTLRLTLDMTGTNIRVLVDGVQVISVTDASHGSAGRGGLALGFHASATPTVTDTNGMHLDNFRISPPLADSKGTNHGDYLGGATLGVTGAIAADVSTAASFDGVNDFGSATRQIADDFSLELWFKSTQGIGTGTQWWSGAGLVDAEVAGAANDFGVSLRSDGRVVAGVGTPDVSVVSSAGGYNNGAWHHVVFTRVRTSGALTLYVDGAVAGTATGSTLSLTSPSTLNLGRIQAGGNYLLGSLDEVAVYNTVLSAAMVGAHYTAGTS